ncbi:hypothetical protein ACSSUQ_004227 [Yersinia enterocolitica]
MGNMGLSKTVDDLLKIKRSIENSTDDESDNVENNSDEENVLTLENDLVLLGIVWNAIRPLQNNEKIYQRIYINENLIVEKGENSFWLYGKEDLIEESIITFHDRFSKEIRGFKYIRPESEHNIFTYLFFKDALMCRFNVLVSYLPHERNLQQVMIKDVIRELKKDFDNMDVLNKRYFHQMLNCWITDVLVKKTHLAM